MRVLDAAVVQAPRNACQPLRKHRHEHAVNAEERAPEVDAPPEVIQLASGGFREPVIDTGEHREDRPRRDNVVEVPDDVVRVVQMQIGCRQA